MSRVCLHSALLHVDSNSRASGVSVHKALSYALKTSTAPSAAVL